jgi:hypothetical protein
MTEDIEALKEAINRKVEEMIDERLDARMKPEPDDSVWNRAPEWARFWAQDPDGSAWFYELKPRWYGHCEEWTATGGMVVIDPGRWTPEHSRASLTERPARVEPENTPEIDWSQAPDWAQFAAMDEDGEWYWYGLKPRTHEGADCWYGGGKSDYYKNTGCVVGWRSSLVERPSLNPWSEDPDYPVSDWQFEVRNNDTRLGYREWVERRREDQDAN